MRRSIEVGFAIAEAAVATLGLRDEKRALNCPGVFEQLHRQCMSVIGTVSFSIQSSRCRAMGPVRNQAIPMNGFAGSLSKVPPTAVFFRTINVPG